MDLDVARALNVEQTNEEMIFSGYRDYPGFDGLASFDFVTAVSTCNEVRIGRGHDWCSVDERTPEPEVTRGVPCSMTALYPSVL
jgi:hypothetical protein